MAETKLTVSGMGVTITESLKPRGTVIGRGATCDVILDHDLVSRLHARIYRDPFGRWIIEDLDSRNGVFVDGERIKARAISPGQQILIAHFSLSLADETDQKTATKTSTRKAIPIIDRGGGENIVSFKTGQEAVLSPALVKHLNEFTAGLLKLSSPAELYSEACLRLAEMLNTLVAVVRLPSTEQPLPDSPEILACQFGDSETSAAVLEATDMYLSKSVLEAIRAGDAPVMAGSGASSETDMMLTVIDTQKPHLVFAARVNDLGDAVDALYLDILESKSPADMFSFVEAAARQINFMQKNLFLIELQKKEQALREANIQLKEKDRIKDEYVSRVTHDIKGHLAAIQSCLFVAGSKSSGPLSEKQSDFLGRATARTKQLTDFVKELLNLTQMRLSGRMAAREFAMADTISKALDTIAPKAKDKSITVTSAVDPSIGLITGDEFSINEMTTNLLFNAVKYTPENKTIHLEAAGSNDHIRIAITDTGIGIPAGEIEHVFDEFFRASNAKESEKDGTGLGLSIVKQIVERHGGEISAQSKEGHGTTFTVILPRGG